MNFDFTDPNISDYEFAKRFVEAYKKEAGELNLDDFIIDPVQLKKLNELVEFFEKTAKDLGGEIVSVDINPVLPSNGVTANFIVFDLLGDEIKKFCDVIQHCSAISMDVTSDDEICISCTIPNIFFHKDLM